MLTCKNYNMSLVRNFEVIPIGLSQLISLLYDKNTSLKKLEQNLDQFI